MERKKLRAKAEELSPHLRRRHARVSGVPFRQTYNYSGPSALARSNMLERLSAASRILNIGLGLSLLAYAAFLPSYAVGDVNTECTKPSETEVINSAIDYYIKSRQPIGGLTFADDGATEEYVYLPYKDREELTALNPNCCKVTEPRDTDGPLYTTFQVRRYDVQAVIEVKVRRRSIANGEVHLGQERTDLLPINSCGEIIKPLLGE